MPNSATLIYLDQNVLSNLRDRKISESTNDLYALLRIKLLQARILYDGHIIYSKVILEEIARINNKVYLDEHLDVLTKLNAYLLEDEIGELFHPHTVFKAYQEDARQHQEIEHDYNNFLKDLNCVRNYMGDGLGFASESLVFALNFFHLLPKLAPNVKTKQNPIMIAIENYKHELKINSLVQPFKEIAPQFNPKYYKIPFENYLGKPIEEIEEKFVILLAKWALALHYKDLNFLKLFDDLPIDNKTEFIYMFLNWIGYYPDKYQNTREKSGYFGSSMRDAKHAKAGLFCRYVISEDTNFRKKANACYAYLGATARVFHPRDFLFIDLSQSNSI